MSYLLTIIKALFTLAIIIVVIFYTGVSVLFNYSSTKKALLNEINNSILKPFDTELTIQSVSTSPLSLSIFLNEATLKSKKTIQNCNTNDCYPFIKLHRIQISLNLIQTIKQRHLIINNVNINNSLIKLSYNTTQGLLLPFTPTKVETDNSTFTPLQYLQEIKKHLPQKFTLSETSIIIESQSLEKSPPNELFNCNIKHIDLLIPQDTNIIIDANINKCLLSTNLFMTNTYKTISLTTTSFNATINPLGEINIINLSSISNLGDFKFKGMVKLLNGTQLFSANIKTLATIDLKNTLDIFELKSRGSLEFNGNINFSPHSLIPKIRGDINWSADSNIDGYSLYKGKARLNYFKNNIDLTNLFITMPNNALIKGEMNAEFKNSHVYLTTSSSIENGSFIELMKGLGVDTNAVSFNFNTSALSLDVDVFSKNNATNFILTAKGPIKTNNLIVPSMHTKTRTPLPECSGEVQLIATNEQLSLTNTKLSCATNKSDSMIVTKGIVEFISGQTFFQIDGKNIDLSSIEYFLLDNPRFFSQTPTKGIATTFTGIISSKNSSSPVIFTSNITAINVSLYGVNYNNLAGEIGVDNQKVFGKNLRAFIGAPQSGEILLNTFFVNFDAEATCEFNGKILGKVSSIFQALEPIINQEIISTEKIDGTINNMEVFLKGSFSPKKQKNSKQPHNINPPFNQIESTLQTLLQWDNKINLNISNFVSNNIKTDNLQFNSTCTSHTCTNSSIKINNIAYANNSTSTGNNFINIDIKNLTTSSISASGKSENIPISITSNKTTSFFSNMTNNFSIDGNFDKWRGFFDTHLSNMEIFNIKLSPFKILCTSLNDGIIDLQMEGNQGQVRARGKIPTSLSGESTIYLSLDNFNLTKIIPEKFIKEYGLTSEISLSTLLKGTAPFTPIKTSEWEKITSSILPNMNKSINNSNKNWYNKWSATGKIQKFNGLIKSMTYTNNTTSNFTFTNGVLILKNIDIDANKQNEQQFNMESEIAFDVYTNELQSISKINLELNTLPLLFPEFENSNGILSVEVETAGQPSSLSLSGKGVIKQGTIALKSIPPEFKNIDLLFSFSDKSIDIESFKAQKGEGSISASGIIDWSQMFIEKDSLPMIRINAKLDSFQTRIPIIGLQSVDTELDGNITVCRRQNCNELTKTTTLQDNQTSPILISGKLSIQDARITRGLDCLEIMKSFDPLNSSVINDNSSDIWAFDIVAQARESLSIDTKCARSRLTSNNLHFFGSLSSPQLVGKIETLEGTGSGQLSNIKFAIDKAVMEFDGNPKNPRLDILLSTSVVGYKIDRQRVEYKVSIHIDDRPLNDKGIQPEIRADPPTHPDGQRVLTQTDLVLMILSGRGPDASSPIGLSTDVVINEFYSKGTNVIFSEARLESSLSRMLNRLSAGIVDGLGIEPIFEEGKPRFRLTAVMSPIENLDVKVQYDQDTFGGTENLKNGALTAQWILNKRINLGVDLQVKDLPIGTSFPMGAGIVFRFGEE